jgi:hypothetical protein
MKSPKPYEPPLAESPSLLAVAIGLAVLHRKQQVIILTLDGRANTCEAVGYGITKALSADAQRLAEKAKLAITKT